jgi:nucleotide-binding universal stress UspA family protein
MMWTYPPRSILAAVDFGDASTRALRVARAIGERYGAPVTALHAEALEVPPYFTHDQLQEVERQRAAATKQAARYLQHFVRGVAPDAKSLLIDGPPVPTILAEALRHDLILMGTHGRKGPSRWWAGSVAERVVHQAGIPVLVLRAEDEPTDPAAIFARPLVVAGPGYDGRAKDVIAGLATTFGGSPMTPSVTTPSDLLCRPDASLMAVVVAAEPVEGWLGEVAERLVRSCTLPMLFVPAPR